MELGFLIILASGLCTYGNYLSDKNWLTSSWRYKYGRFTISVIIGSVFISGCFEALKQEYPNLDHFFGYFYLALQIAVGFQLLVGTFLVLPRLGVLPKLGEDK
ncbi:MULTISPECIES: hypothetical protein [Vibrio]|uniref:hypothetical protein n=1 Tax=Vibrio TaxID=662 RepID=UPI001B82340E|nr:MULTISPECIES: hypothetical protein [Vibrio]BDP38312.1 hypothetical protein VA208B3_46830 [Vibrio alginolyticus]MDF5646537.1 hypothetical protein [Vibrio parahaemolyticus]MDF5666205.1 hypothetical protein [Vibrio parahaemolyticus]WKV19461.1 hypothetical protein [Vibrio parahaemolyticus]BDP33444.1 hypothetical protein VV208B2_45240 [Vibrio vulnificus]